MSSTTSDAEQNSKSGGPQGCVDRSRSASVILPLRHLSLRHSSLHLSHVQHNGDMEVVGCLPASVRLCGKSLMYGPQIQVENPSTPAIFTKTKLF